VPSLTLNGWNLSLNSAQQLNGVAWGLGMPWGWDRKGVETECVSFNFIFSLHLEGLPWLRFAGDYNTLHTFA